MTSTSYFPREWFSKTVHSSPSRVIKSQGNWVSPSRSQHSPAAYKHPRQSWSKDYSPAAYQRSKESLPQHIKTPPEESNLIPQESWNPSPQSASLSTVDSGSLSPQSTNASPGFIQRVISLPGYNWVILSQKPRKERPRRSLLTPAKSINTSNNKGIPNKLLSTLSKASLFPQSIASQHGH